VAHTWIPSYSGGRDQEDLSSKQAWANSSGDPILKKNNHKKQEWGVAGGVTQGVGPEFKPQYCKKIINLKNQGKMDWRYGSSSRLPALKSVKP
jgi:hypothetical protein